MDERLTPGSSYEVYVRAKNGEIISQWSGAGTGRTSIGNSEPTFDDRDSVDRDNDGDLPDADTDRTVAENARPGQSVGRAVGAVDGNGDRRTYRLVAADGDAAPDVNNFDINTSTGQILTKEPLNHEDVDGCGYDDTANPTQCTYTVKVQVWDGRDEHRNEQDTSTITDDIIDDEITVNITVSDMAERPLAPTVTVTSPEVANGATEATLTVTWDRPENAGPPLTGYVVECTGDGITADNPCPPAHWSDSDRPGAIVHDKPHSDRPHSEQFLSSACAGGQQRGRGRVVDLGHAVDQQRRQYPARFRSGSTRPAICGRERSFGSRAGKGD